MRKALVVLNHSLTEEQVSDLNYNWLVGEIVYLPDSLKQIWSEISPEAGLTELCESIKPIIEWIENTSGRTDVVVIQGEATAVYQVVRAVQRRYPQTGMKCLAATTARIVEEIPLADGSISKKSTFKHVRFRPYF
jgi:hypothetical protein